MNKLRQLLGLDPEYNKKAEEALNRFKQELLRDKACSTCRYCIPFDSRLPGFVEVGYECEFGGLAKKTCSRYELNKNLDW